MMDLEIQVSVEPDDDADVTWSCGHAKSTKWNPDQPRDNDGKWVSFGGLKASDDPAPGGEFYYHSTPVKNLAGIHRGGLKPGKTSGVTSLAPHLDSALWWKDALSSGGETATLRLNRLVAREGHEDGYDENEPTAELWTSSTVDTTDLEVWMNGRWEYLPDVDEELLNEFKKGTKFNSDQPRDDHGRWTGDGGGSTTVAGIPADPQGLVDESAPGYEVHDVKTAFERLADGKFANVKPGNVREFVGLAAKRSDHLDLTNLHVDGMKIYGGDGLGIARGDMPQIPEEHRDGFIEYLKSEGVGVIDTRVSPFELMPAQKEISATKTGQILNRLGDDAPNKLGEIFVSADNYVLDGHHRWSVVTTLAVSNKKVTSRITRINAKHEKALEKMIAYAKANGIENLPHGKAGFLIEKGDPDQPRDDHGRWTSGGGTSGSGATGSKGPVRNGAKAVPLKNEVRERVQEGGDAKEIFNYLKENQPDLVEETSALIARAQVAQQEFKDGLDQIKEKIGAKFHTNIESRDILEDESDWVVLGPVKTVDRAVIKIATDYDGDVGRLKDTVRGTIAVQSAENMLTAIEEVSEMGDIVEIKNTFEKPLETGYRDLKLSVRLKNSGHVAEIQMQVKPLLRAKQEGGWKLYEQMRQLSPKSERYSSLLSESRKRYDEAWAKFGGAALVTALTGVALSTR